MSQAQGVAFTGDVQAISAALCAAGVGVVGVAALDTSASANHVTVYEGTDTSGKVLASFSLAASSGGGVDFAVPRRATAGVYVDTSGACKGTIWVA